jgi:hypothetical protein
MTTGCRPIARAIDKRAFAVPGVIVDISGYIRPLSLEQKPKDASDISVWSYASSVRLFSAREARKKFKETAGSSRGKFLGASREVAESLLRSCWELLEKLLGTSLEVAGSF